MNELETLSELLDFDPVPERAAASRAASLVGLAPEVIARLQAVANDRRRSAREWLALCLAIDQGQRRAA